MEFDYLCEDCKYEFRIEQGFMDKKLTVCPECSGGLSRVINEAPYCAVRPEITTVGQLADKNTKMMGKYKLQERERDDNLEMLRKSKEARKEVNKLANLTPERKERYIMEGR